MMFELPGYDNNSCGPTRCVAFKMTVVFRFFGEKNTFKFIIQLEKTYYIIFYKYHKV